MTEAPRLQQPTGKRARWSTALVLAPGAAAVFGVSVWWAAEAVPTTASASPASDNSPVASSQTTEAIVTDTARQLQLQEGLAAQQARSATLQRTLVGLRTDLVRLDAAAAAARKAAAAAAAGGSTGGANQSVSTGGSYQPAASGSGSGSSGGGGSAQLAPIAAAPAPVAAPPPVVVQAPAPPVQATTGASGKP